MKIVQHDVCNTPGWYLKHDKHMYQMMKRCQVTGLKLNPDKCKFKQKNIKFYGIMRSENGVQPDPAKKTLKNKTSIDPENICGKTCSTS